MKFSGSYNSDDVEFLVKIIDIEFVDIAKKEMLIQSKKSHYSNMISREYEPTKEYLDIFYNAFEANRYRFAKDILSLAYNLSLKKNIVLISLLRAGTPIGVLVKRALKEVFKIEVKHYSISIIRDREIDNEALKYIYKNHQDSEFIFIDGWTGKGVINRELKKFVAKFNLDNSTNISNKLYVISDVAHISDYCVNNDDYLIPSSALNSTISGLVSRSILNRDFIFDGDFHGCRYYKEYANSDLSLWFIDEILNIIKTLKIDKKPLLVGDNNKNREINNFFKELQREYNIDDINHIKPSIAEASRVLLRRVPYIIFVRDLKILDISHILVLAKEKGVRVIEDKNLPYQALAIIKDVIR